MSNEPPLLRADRFMPERECFCQYRERQKTSQNFNWVDVELEKGDLSLATFEKQEELKSGYLLLRCRRCQRSWILDGPGSIAWLVDQAEVNRLKVWSKRDLRPSPEMRRVLVEIGEPEQPVMRPEDQKLMNDRDQKIKVMIEGRFGPFKEWPSRMGPLHAVPCRIHMKDGKSIDPAIVLFGLPYVQSIEKFLFFDQVKTVGPSPYTLPIAIRQAAAQADEIRMSFAPTIIQGPSMHRYVITDDTTFFERDGELGSQMQPAKMDPQQVFKLPHSQELKIGWILADQ